MTRFVAFAIPACLLLWSCGPPAAIIADSPVRAATTERKGGERTVRVSGTIQALQSVSIRVPQISAQAGRGGGWSKRNGLEGWGGGGAMGGWDKKREGREVQRQGRRTNLERRVIKAPHPGMIALENPWRKGSMGPPQEGDMLSPGQAVLR